MRAKEDKAKTIKNQSIGSPLLNPVPFLDIESFVRENDKALRRLFSGKIKGNFLTEMLHKIVAMLGEDILKCYDHQITNEKMISTGLEHIEYDICRHIVGTHRANLIFLQENERLERERSEEYKSSLAKQVIQNIKLRQYGSAHFRSRPLLKGDDFIYYPLPYDLFVISAKIHEILASQRNANLWIIYYALANKALAALSLLEDNFLDSAYPLCRGIIELYVKLLLLIKYPEAREQYFKFSGYELDKSCCTQEYSEEFKDLFSKRKNKSCNNKVEYLHYGWVDCISDYHAGGYRPYSTTGIISFLRDSCNEGQLQQIDIIEGFYKMCHGYTHGNIYQSKYPLLHYFEISIMLYYTIGTTYNILCDNLGDSKDINDIDIIEKLENDYNLLYSQYLKRSTENFEMYYKK